MRKIFLILKFEVLTLLTNRTFWLMTVAFPAVILLLNVGTQLMASDMGGTEELFLGAEGAEQTVGYVDHSGLLDRLPPGLPEGSIVAYESEQAADEALEAEEIGTYAIVPADFAESGDLTIVQREFDPFNNTGESFFTFLLAYNLTGDAPLANSLVEPLSFTSGHDVALEMAAAEGEIAPGAADGSSGGGLVNTEGAEAGGAAEGMAFLVPFAVMFIFFFLIVMSSSYMLRSVSREKENRTVEILLVSVSPRELMVGKLLGLSIIALVQMAVWVGGGMLIMGRAGELLDTASSLNLPLTFLLWATLYLVLGYLLYASLMGAVGALAPNSREANQFVFPILLPLMIPMWLNYSLTSDPGGTIALVLSLFPLTAPAAMMTRLAAASVPLWQLLASVGLLALTTYGLVALSARFFRADTLLSDSSIKWRQLLTAWRK